MRAIRGFHPEVSEVMEGMQAPKRRLSPVNAWPWRGGWSLSGDIRGLMEG